MKVYDAPKVTLLTRQQFLYPDHINWQTDTENGGEQIAEFAGRLCYLSFGEESGIEGHKTSKGRTGNKPYMDNIKSVKHGSVIEHATWSFLFEGVSRSLTHELVRHRAGMSYSQLSQRYVDESEVAFVRPPEIEVFSSEYYDWKDACMDARDAYLAILNKVVKKLEKEDIPTTMKKKRARQTARSVLPNCTETKIVVTGNARSWRHFIEMRASKGADTEIRKLAIEVLKVLKVEAPNIFDDYEIQEFDGTEIAVTSNSNV